MNEDIKLEDFQERMEIKDSALKIVIQLLDGSMTTIDTNFYSRLLMICKEALEA